MTYNEVKQRIYDLLDMPLEEAKRLGYTDKIPRALNEAFFRIAHSVFPLVREYHLKFETSKLPAKVTMPPDFISFADEQDAYLNGKYFILTKFFGESGIILTGREIENHLQESDECNYIIYYNASYPKLIDGGKNFQKVELSLEPNINEESYSVVKIPAEEDRVTGNQVLNIPDIAANLAPHYVVSQLVNLDDKVRSIAEMNEFETLLSIVSSERHERQREYHSVRGWY